MLHILIALSFSRLSRCRPVSAASLSGLLSLVPFCGTGSGGLHLYSTSSLLMDPRLEKCQDNLKDEYAQFHRGRRGYRPFTLLAWAQPIPAIIGIAGCIVVFAFCSATWWESPVTFAKVAIGYAAVSLPFLCHSPAFLCDQWLTTAQPVVLLPIFLTFKLFTRQGWIRTGKDFTPLARTLDRLRWYKTDEIRPRDDVEATRDLQPPSATMLSDVRE